MTAPTTTAAAQEYLAAVEAELADLPAEERSELLEDLSMHLSALEEEGDERTLAARLGSASDYAAELRAAAGLPPRSGASKQAAWRTGVSRVRGSAAVREVRAFLPQLRPAWWVLRGYLVVAIPSLRAVNGTRDFPLPAPFGNHGLGLVLVALAVVASVALGRRRLPRLGMAVVVVLDLVLLGAALDLVHDARWRLATANAVFVAAPVDTGLATSPLASKHGAVTNVFPYAADGTPLDGVLLFDQDGRPLQTGLQQWWADGCRRVVSAPRAADGVAVAFSYPKQYVLDPSGTSLDGTPTTPSQCTSSPARPKVPLPTFAKPSAAPKAVKH